MRSGIPLRARNLTRDAIRHQICQVVNPDTLPEQVRENLKPHEGLALTQAGERVDYELLEIIIGYVAKNGLLKLWTAGARPRPWRRHRWMVYWETRNLRDVLYVRNEAAVAKDITDPLRRFVKDPPLLPQPVPLTARVGAVNQGELLAAIQELTMEVRLLREQLANAY